jgi:hypothetical protein
MLRTEVPVYEGVIDACRGGDIANRYGRWTASGEQLVRGVEYGSHYGLAALRSRGLAREPFFLARFWKRPKYARATGAWLTIHRFVPLSSPWHPMTPRLQARPRSNARETQRCDGPILSDDRFRNPADLYQ